MDAQTLSEFQTLLIEVAQKLNKGEKVQGWVLKNVSYYDITGEDGMPTGTKRASLRVVSKGKTHNGMYARFYGYCTGDICRVEDISFSDDNEKGLY